jgi:alpha-L-fucosidase
MKTIKISLIYYLPFLLTLLGFSSCHPGREESPGDEPSSDEKNKLEWFNEAKFGLFIHWGLYAVPAGEWEGKSNYGEWIQYSANIPGVEYEKLADQFNPIKFNAEEWVSLAKRAGMKYLVITAKHHEGFCMFDSKLTDFDIVDATPYGQDPLKELAAECHRQGITFCTYYSVKDWHHENYPVEYTYHTKTYPEGFIGYPERNQPDYQKYFAYLRGQVKELLTNYGPVGIIWFDWPGYAFDPENVENRKLAEQLVDSIHKWQPDCLINNRLSGIGADYGTPEQEIPEGTQDKAFEVCMTLNNHWGYNKYDNDWKTPEEVIYNLCDIASKGGNYLLNIGPTAAGLLPQKSQEILKSVGKWLAVNGEAIYNTTNWGPSVRWNPDIEMITAKPGILYLHIFQYPSDHVVYLNDFRDQCENAYLLADSSRKPLQVDAYPQGHGLIIHLPEEPLDSINNIIVIEYSGKIQK